MNDVSQALAAIDRITANAALLQPGTLVERARLAHQAARQADAADAAAATEAAFALIRPKLVMALNELEDDLADRATFEPEDVGEWVDLVATVDGLAFRYDGERGALELGRVCPACSCRYWARVFVGSLADLGGALSVPAPHCYACAPSPAPPVVPMDRAVEPWARLRLALEELIDDRIEAATGGRP